MSAKSLGKPLTMTVEREAWYRSARGIACAPLYVPDLLAEIDALRAALADLQSRYDARGEYLRAAAQDKDCLSGALADERKHSDALALRGKLLRDAAHAVLGWVEGHAHVEEDEIEIEVQRWDEFLGKHAARRAAEKEEGR